MITLRINSSNFLLKEAADEQFMAQQREAKLEDYMPTLAATDGLIDFEEMATAADKACPRVNRSMASTRRTWPRRQCEWCFCKGCDLLEEKCMH